MDQANERRYQVFVSSTFVDLQEERRKALDAILEAQAFPAGMELFPSADDDQFEFIKREIESSDYYIVIVAGRYGSLAPDGLSFTEKEYDYALSLTKPVMAFLHKDLGELRGKALEPEQAQRERLQAFRAKVSAGKLVKFYSNPDELKAQVAQALNSAFRLKPQIGWVRATNARRIEDLEEITRLQRHAMELEGEVARLRALGEDPKNLLAKGDEKVGFNLKLRPVRDRDSDNDTPIDPPALSAAIEFSWDEIVEISIRPFEGGVTPLDAIARLREAVLKRIVENAVDAEEWAEAVRSSVARKEIRGIDETTIQSFYSRAFTHLQGLEYVQAEMVNGNPYWRITQAGLTRLALIRSRKHPLQLT